MVNNELNGSVHEKKRFNKKRILQDKINTFKIDDERMQRVAQVNISKEEYRNIRDFIKKYGVVEPQGLSVTHNISWNAGDRILNSVSDSISRLTGGNRVEAPPPFNRPMTREEMGNYLVQNTTERPPSNENTFVGVDNIFPSSDFGSKDYNFISEFMGVLSSQEFIVSLVIVNLIAYGMHRKKVNLIGALALSTLLIVNEMRATKGDVHAISDILQHQATMSQWMENTTEQNLDNVDVTMEEIPAPQGFGDMNDYLVEVIVAFVSLGLGVKAKSPFFHTISNMMKVSDKTKENMASTLLSISNKFSNFFNETVKNETLATFFYVDVVSDEDVKSLLNNIQEYIASCNAGTTLCQGYRETVYATLLEDITKTLKRLDKHSFEFKTLSNAFNEVLKQNTLQKSFSKALSGDRVEPVAVLIYGKPGTFKTILLDRIQKIVSRYTIPEAWRKDFDENAEQFLYALPNDKFYDGYTYRAWVITADDLFQKREAVGDADPDSVKTIKIVNTAPFLLPMAQASEKNTRYLRSPFFMGTTNLENFGLLEAVLDTGAVERRYNIRLDVTINKKYLSKKGNLDYSKVPMLTFVTEENVKVHSTAIPEDFWDITLIEHKASLKLPPVKVTFEQVIRKIISSHRDKVKNFYINKETTRRTYESIIERLDSEFLINTNNIVPAWNMNPNTVAVPQGLSDSMEIRPLIDEDGNKVFCPQPSGQQWDHEDHIYRPVERSVSPDDSLSNFGASNYYKRLNHPFGPHVPDGDLIETSMPGSFVGSTYEFDRNCHNPIMDYIFNRHPTMYHGFAMGALVALGRNGRQGLFDANLMCLNMHLTAIPLPRLLEILEGLNNDTFFMLLENSLRYCDEEHLDYFTLQPKFTYGVSTIQKMYAKMKHFGKGVYNFVKRHFMTILVGAGFVGAAAFYLWKFYKKMFHASSDNEPQSVDQTRMASSGYARRVGKSTRLSSFVRISNVAQGLIIDSFEVQKLPKLDSLALGNRSGTSDIMIKIMNKYFFIVYIFFREKDTGKTAYTRLGHMTNLIGNVFVHPFHYVFQIVDFMQNPNRDSFQMVMVTTSKTICYRFPMSDFLDNFHTTDFDADEDRSLFICKHAQNTSAGIMKYLVNEGDIKAMRMLTRIKSSLLGSYNNIEGGHLSLRVKDVHASVNDTISYVKANWTGQMDDIYGIERTLTYEADLSAGDCGSLLFSTDSNFQNRVILGMHIAGTNKSGFSTMMTYEDMRRFIESCDVSILAFDEELDPGCVDFVPINEPQGYLQHVGIVHKGDAPTASVFSDIKKSKLYGELPEPYHIVNSIPAKLRPFVNSEGVTLDPAEISLRSYKRSPGCIPYEFIENAAGSYEQLLMNASVSYNYPRDVIGIKEALHHFRDVKPIASSTSPGYPMNLSKYPNLKKLYFRAMEENNLEKAEEHFQQIATEVERVIALYESYVRPFFVYTDNNKDEVRKKEKALKGLTRLFSGCPFIMLIIFRMYFGAFMDMFFGCNINIGSAIGVNPYSMDWDRIARKLQQFGQILSKWLVGAGDFAFFDGHQQACVLQPICQLIINWYGGTMKDIPNKIRYFLWAEITNSRHIFWGLYYEWYSSLPSGNPMTAIINTMYNNMVFRIAYQFADLDIDTFNRDVYMVALGDDVLFSVAPWLYDHFNEITLPDLMKKCGMIYTNELKETATIPFRELEEVEFLKRSFVKHRGLNRWIAPLRVESIINMLCWTKKKNSDQVAVDNIGVAIREFTLHGQETFEYWYTVLMKLWNVHYPFVEMNCIVSGTHSLMLKRVLDSDDFTF
jgi:hypothetical protein